MNTLEEIKAILLIHKEELQKKYKFKNIGLFGSYVNGSANESSDIDILVEFEEPIGLDFVVLADELETILNGKVDLVSKNAIKPRLFQYVKKDLLYV